MFLFSFCFVLSDKCQGYDCCTLFGTWCTFLLLYLCEEPRFSKDLFRKQTNKITKEQKWNGGCYCCAVVVITLQLHFLLLLKSKLKHALDVVGQRKNKNNKKKKDCRRTFSKKNKNKNKQQKKHTAVGVDFKIGVGIFTGKFSAGFMICVIAGGLQWTVSQGPASQSSHRMLSPRWAKDQGPQPREPITRFYFFNFFFKLVVVTVYRRGIQGVV